MDIFLYRGREPRPKEHFWPVNFAHNPKSPWHLETFESPRRVLFEVRTDLCSLQGDEPLWFHIDSHGLDLNSCGIIFFHKTGGGGRGIPATLEDDAATLRSLFDALRSFPADWETEVGLLGPEQK